MTSSKCLSVHPAAYCFLFLWERKEMKIIGGKKGQQSLILFRFSCSCDFFYADFLADGLLPLIPVGARLFPQWLIFYGWFYFKWKIFLALKNQSERRISPRVQRLLNGIWHATFPWWGEEEEMCFQKGMGTCRYSISLWQRSSHPSLEPSSLFPLRTQLHPVLISNIPSVTVA